MSTKDSETLRDLLRELFPGLKFEEVLKESGQRVVYFAYFEHTEEKEERRKEEEELSEEEVERWKEVEERWKETERRISWGKIVLKVTEELSARQIARLQKEIEILNSLNSPYYPTLLLNDVFSENPATEEKLKKRLFVTIEERLNAKPLCDVKDLFNSQGTVLDLLIKLVNALSQLWNHKSRLIHRDLKPENILIDGNGEVAIIDLGIIREEGVSGLTLTNYHFGPCSPPYASPEQARNDKKNINFKSDFFSLGTLSYELLTGGNPFITEPDNSVEEVLDNVVNLVPPTLIELNKASKPFSLLVEKLMKKEPYKRHRTIENLLSDLQAAKRET